VPFDLLPIVPIMNVSSFMLLLKNAKEMLLLKNAMETAMAAASRSR
jgi:sRNA-binding regulator protein Hfq